MYERQDGRCAVCKKSFPRLDVDHDHATGLVRGLLCRRCNLAVGFIESGLMDRYTAYIEASR